MNELRAKGKHISKLEEAWLTIGEDHIVCFFSDPPSRSTVIVSVFTRRLSNARQPNFATCSDVGQS